jgi:hypothetical protein
VATKDQFTEQEWDQLKRGVMGAALWVSVSDPGLFESFKEASTAARHMAQGRQSQSELVRELAQERPGGFGIGTSPQELEEQTLAALRDAVAAVRSKAPQEEDRYRQFVLDVARSVAEAAEGVSAGESGALERIRSALGTDTSGT